MNQFFLAYEAHRGSTVNRGYVLFTDKAETTEEIGLMFKNKLEEIRNQYDGVDIIAIASNKI